MPGVWSASDGYARDRGFGEPAEGHYDTPVDVFAFSGTAVALRTAALREIGLFADEFFTYYEDTDLSWRLRLAGWQIRYEPAAVVHHLHAATSDATFTEFRLLQRAEPVADADPERAGLHRRAPGGPIPGDHPAARAPAAAGSTGAARPPVPLCATDGRARVVSAPVAALAASPEGDRAASPGTPQSLDGGVGAGTTAGRGPPSHKPHPPVRRDRVRRGPSSHPFMGPAARRPCRPAGRSPRTPRRRSSHARSPTASCARCAGRSGRTAGP